MDAGIGKFALQLISEFQLYIKLIKYNRSY
jgi:hypothetical protein